MYPGWLDLKVVKTVSLTPVLCTQMPPGVLLKCRFYWSSQAVPEMLHS
jgi:hypothetical protein